MRDEAKDKIIGFMETLEKISDELYSIRGIEFREIPNQKTRDKADNLNEAIFLIEDIVGYLEDVIED